MTEIDGLISAATGLSAVTGLSAATGPGAVTGLSAATGPGAGRSELMLMLLSDARLPTGAHTQSAGLEPAINGGMPARDVPRYITARLRTVTRVEAGAAVVARHLSSGPDPGTGLALVDLAWRARTISPALRETSALLGRGYGRLVGRLWPEHPAVVALQAIRLPCRAVVLGVAAACTGLAPMQLGRLIGYDEAQTIAAAALKIAPLDPVDATAWVIGAQDDIERMAGSVAGLTEPDEIPAFGAPLIEQWAEIHSTTTQRLFRA